MKEAGFRATKTVRENKLAKRTFLSNKDFKEKRGVSGHRFDAANHIFVLKWPNKNFVSVASNHFSLEPVRAVERRAKGLIRKTAVQQTYPNREHNKYIGRIDLHDWLISKYAVWTLFKRTADSVRAPVRPDCRRCLHIIQYGD